MGAADAVSDVDIVAEGVREVLGVTLGVRDPLAVTVGVREVVGVTEGVGEIDAEEDVPMEKSMEKACRYCQRACIGGRTQPSWSWYGVGWKQTVSKSTSRSGATQGPGLTAT